MKFSLALIAISAAVASANPFAPAKSANSAKTAYVSKLMRNARSTSNSQLGRKLDEAEDEEEYEIDISGYSLKFEQCQFVKAYDDELAGEDSETILATKRFVIFRLCPSDACDSCSYNFGEYIVDLEEYLEATVEYQQEMQEEMCDACQECNNWEENEEENEQDEDDEGRRRRLESVDCDTCYDECMKIENMEDNGYIDATEFLECQMIYDPEDDGKAALYAGPMCASSGSKIKIGVFYDEDCNVPDSDKDVDDYLMDGDGVSMKLSHALLKTVYSTDCISCLQPEEEDDNDDQNDDGEEKEVEVLEMCEQLYEASAKCEKTNGFDSGYADYDGYENQLAQESVVCDFVESLKAGSYDESGEIVVNGASSSIGGGAETTGGQKFALTFFILGTVGLAGYAAMLHSKLTKGTVGLSDTGGSMA
mmetsp:Transcript_9283/g.19466  ORF Transcript_9283/g.19466 Transcript_9283/m.19466 type:complete len:422 (-) Transcript_9283:142-1407(-)|eukprot:CAMPEP_0201123588 /NCGR_PEP_ID=MMETSP0850-20130426/7867_1 /ASSEMBLY_ACC=CAM_ASM_000622 /TAXON_ID=183588 /ORGANISM="Pseudo-nitzschia fraudulenta, Strain WWA7" /LENGTH=421 /DNA_ID=CAMNT_0047390579 /DNA_START=38 /DNA_END=1303 /DNA_ORIENTATION=+